LLQQFSIQVARTTHRLDDRRPLSAHLSLALPKGLVLSEPAHSIDGCQHQDFPIEVFDLRLRTGSY
jgi:hypothetical protein